MRLTQTTTMGNKDGNAVTVVIKHPFVNNGRVDIQEISLTPQISTSDIFIWDKMAPSPNTHRNARNAGIHRIHKRIDKNDAVPQRTGAGDQKEMRSPRQSGLNGK